MRRMKRVVVGGLLAAVLIMHGAVVFAAEESCSHNWVTYSFEKVYEGERDCTTHDYCRLHEIGYNAIDICTKCGEKFQHHFTQEIHNYVSR